jgi:hypothetical protein
VLIYMKVYNTSSEPFVYGRCRTGIVDETASVHDLCHAS